MLETLRITLSLKNTYRVNGILYSLKQIPILKKILPDELYKITGFKIFANILSLIWEVISVFLGKLIYFLLMIVLASKLYETGEPQLFIHILTFLTFIGATLNSYMFDPSMDKYYAIVLLNIDAKKFTLVNYFYSIVKVVVSFAWFGIMFGLIGGVPIWQCLLIPFFVAGAKMTFAVINLIKYERTGNYEAGKPLVVLKLILVLIMLASAYGLPAMGIIIPVPVSAAVMAVFTVTGICSVRKILSFKDYRTVYRRILLETANSQAELKTTAVKQNHNIISADVTVESKKKGFEYLNEIFIKRHRKILWKPSLIVTAICAGIIVVLLVVSQIVPESKEGINGAIMNSLPLSLFIMYIINRGARFTQALFINCDHSLLTYSFYKQPKFILKLFWIRLREIIKINILPAIIIGAGLSLLLFTSGGTDSPLNYVIIAVSIIFLSIFFSIHFLTVYYLLQPYNAATEIKSGTYQIVNFLTYFVCYIAMQFNAPILYFGIASIIFCVLYTVVASVLVYKLAPKTFKIRA